MYDYDTLKILHKSDPISCQLIIESLDKEVLYSKQQFGRCSGARRPPGKKIVPTLALNPMACSPTFRQFLCRGNTHVCELHVSSHMQSV